MDSQRGWQVGKTLRQCNGYMFDNQVACDVNFYIQTPDDTVVKIPAHQYMLISRSPVFEAMLCGPGNYSESTGDVVITDIEPPVFKAMLRFVYTETAFVTADNVLYLMTAAKKYLLPELEQKCLTFLDENLDIENVCTVFDHAVSHGIEGVTAKCLGLIQPNTTGILNSETYLELSQASLTKLLEFDNLSVESEKVIYDAVKKWAAHKCSQMGESADENPRTILGDSLLQVRFCSMTNDDFADIGFSEVLTDKEFRALTVFNSKKWGSDENWEKARQQLHHFGYNLTPRDVLRATRLHRDKTGICGTQQGCPDAISFNVNRPINVIGISVFASPKKDARHSCDVEVYNGQNEVWEDKTSITLVSDGARSTHDIVFRRPIWLAAGRDHAVKIVMTGCPCYRGRCGSHLVRVAGTDFNFKNHPDSHNGTDATHGQIPDILFRPGEASRLYPV